MAGIPDDVLELAKPAIHKRVEELIDSAFRLASFSEGADVLEKAIDAAQRKHFPEGSENAQDSSILDADLEATQSIKQRSGRNLVVQQPGDRIQDLQRQAPPRPRSTYAMVKADHYGRGGLPLSRYAGVSYSKSPACPWLARYGEKRIGKYKTEVEAARVYDRCRVAAGKPPKNFPQ